MKNAPFNMREYAQQQRVFPEISFDEFQACNDEIVKDWIVAKNRVLSTDAYNRTMNHLKGPKDSANIETFSLSFRRTGEHKNYNIVYWVKRLVRELLELPITQHEIDFAEEAAKYQGEKWGIWYFDKDMWQKVIDEYGGYLPFTIKAVEDGTAVKKWEPAMLIEWPSELVAHFEPMFLQLFLKSSIAWDMHMIEEIIWEWRVIDMGLRSAQSTALHIDSARALHVGWGVTATSNDAATASIEQLTSTWTIAHRYLSVRPNEEEAFRTAVEKSDNMALLVDLNDSIEWIDKAMKLKKEFRDSDKTISMRLDSWDLAAQAIYALQQIEEAGMIDDPKHNKVIPADISTIDDIKEIEEAVKQAGFDPKKHIFYGIWGLLVAKNKTRDAMSAWFKAINTPEGPTGKLSNSIWKEPIPGKPNIEIVENWDGSIERTVVQEDEKVKGKRLLKTVYKNGKILLWEANDNEDLNAARAQVKKSMKWITPGDEPKLSDKTIEVKNYVREKLKGKAA